MTTSPIEHVEAVVVNGTSLAYRELGEGESVVLLHCDISDLRTWEYEAWIAELMEHVIPCA